MNYANQTYPKDEYITGGELYQYLHISKRKMKYLLENGFIPYIDTGKKTHRYIVKRTEAEKFRKRMKIDKALIASMVGQFNSKRPVSNSKTRNMITPEMSKEFKRFLEKKWKEEPGAVEAKRAAFICGTQPQRIYTLCSEKRIFSVKVRERIYCSKESLIEFFGSIERMSYPNSSKAYYELIKEFYENK